MAGRCCKLDGIRLARHRSEAQRALTCCLRVLTLLTLLASADALSSPHLARVTRLPRQRSERCFAGRHLVGACTLFRGLVSALNSILKNQALACASTCQGQMQMPCSTPTSRASHASATSAVRLVRSLVSALNSIKRFSFEHLLSRLARQRSERGCRARGQITDWAHLLHEHTQAHTRAKKKNQYSKDSALVL